MIAKVETIPIQKTARYFVLGEPGPEIREVWFVCHGYGQLAEEFIKNFIPISESHRLIIAPEALNRFYLYATSGKTGASWMTREDRLNEIRDYVSYLDKVYSETMNRLQTDKNIKVHALGFSQGTATVSRWALTGESRVRHIILWGGGVPPDIPWQGSSQKLKNMDFQLIYGEKDPLIKPDYLDKQYEILDRYNINYKVRTFNGFHALNPTILKELAEA